MPGSRPARPWNESRGLPERLETLNKLGVFSLSGESRKAKLACLLRFTLCELSGRKHRPEAKSRSGADTTESREPGSSCGQDLRVGTQSRIGSQGPPPNDPFSHLWPSSGVFVPFLAAGIRSLTKATAGRRAPSGFSFRSWKKSRRSMSSSSFGESGGELLRRGGGRGRGREGGRSRERGREREKGRERYEERGKEGERLRGSD